MKYLDLKLLLLLVCCLLLTFGKGQEYLNHDSFNNKIAKDIVVVEFWVDWNSSNEFAEINKLKECEVYRVDIGACNKLQNKYDVSAVPTVIVFDNGKEKERFLPNIMFRLDADKKIIQNSVDTLILNKFQ